jgi:hypothetical protein
MSENVVPLQQLEESGYNRDNLRRLNAIIRGDPGEEYVLADYLRALGPVPDHDD